MLEKKIRNISIMLVSSSSQSVDEVCHVCIDMLFIFSSETSTEKLTCIVTSRLEIYCMMWVKGKFHEGLLLVTIAVWLKILFLIFLLSLDVFLHCHLSHDHTLWKMVIGNQILCFDLPQKIDLIIGLISIVCYTEVLKASIGRPFPIRTVM